MGCSASRSDGLEHEEALQHVIQMMRELKVKQIANIAARREGRRSREKYYGWAGVQGARAIAGGDAVLLELAGKYADDMFEDIGHSMNARQQLKEFLVGTLDATEEELQALRAPAHTGNGDSFLLVAVAGALVAAVGGYFVFMA